MAESVYALVDGTAKVVNVVVLDDPSAYQAPPGMSVVELAGNAGIGWDYVDGDFVDNRPVSSSDGE